MNRDMLFPACHLQMFMQEKPVTLLREDESVKHGDYLFLVNSLSVELMREYRISSAQNGWFLLKTGEALPMHSYMFSDNDLFYFEGFSGFEDTFRWSTDGESTIYMHLEEGNYVFEVNHIGIPRDILDIRELNYRFFINDNLLAEFDGEHIGSNLTLEIEVPAQYVFDGLNSFTIRYDTWSPTEYGSPDGRLLGIAINGIEVVEVEPYA